MVEQSRLDTLQDEIKLLKAEVKNSLASVRDYLLNMELPSSEFSTILAALAGDNGDAQKMNVDSHVSNDKPMSMPQPDFTKEEPANEEKNLPDETGQPGEFEEMLDFEDTEDKAEEVAETPPEDFKEETLPPEEEETEEELPDEVEEEAEDVRPEDELGEPEGDETDELADEEPELPMEEVPSMENDQAINDVNRGLPKVNMLANLINWVARARQEIGYEQLPALLEVYGTTGYLSPELKDIIIQLAEIIQDNAETATASEIWSESIMSLHGILTGGDAPLNPVIPSWVDTTDEAESLADEEIIEVDKAKEKQAKLKLVFPSGNGKSKEFCINLTPEENGDS
jgi:hypothetical protein